MTDRALSVGAGDMDAPEFLMRVVQEFAEGDRIGKVTFISSSTDPAEHGQPGEKIVDGFPVIHPGKCIKKELRI